MAPPPSTAPAVMLKGKGKGKGTAKAPKKPAKGPVRGPAKGPAKGPAGGTRAAKSGAQEVTNKEDPIIVDEDTVTSTAEQHESPTGSSLPEVTTTELGLGRIDLTGQDTYEPGTAAPRAHQQVIAGLETVDPEVEDLHDALLADLAAEEAAELEDIRVLNEGDD